MRMRSIVVVTSLVVGIVACASHPVEEDTGTSKEAIRNGTSIRSPYTVQLGGCTGYLLCGGVVLTAGHCRPKVGQTVNADGKTSTIARVATISTAAGVNDLAVA